MPEIVPVYHMIFTGENVTYLCQYLEVSDLKSSGLVLNVSKEYLFLVVNKNLYIVYLWTGNESVSKTHSIVMLNHHWDMSTVWNFSHKKHLDLWRCCINVE